MADKVFWLISVKPIKGENVFEQVDRQTAKEHSYSTNYKFEVPAELKPGTLDSLMALSDDLSRIDTFVENTTKKIVRQLMEISDKKPDKSDQLTANNVPLDTYLQQFEWDKAKYPVRSSLKELVDKINAQVGKYDEELKAKAVDYNQISNSIAAEERKTGGSLLIRSLTDLVKPEDVHNTEYLTTLMVVVQKAAVKDWMACYETLTPYVLPRSSKCLAEDTEYALHTVVLFRRVAEDFKNIAREKKFTVREFKIDDESKVTKEERTKMITEKDRQKRSLVRWCKTHFAEAFVAWIHLKAIRVFVESVLRYGVPPTFKAILVVPNKKEEKRLRDTLQSMFAHLASVNAISGGAEEEKFYPYVYIPIDLSEL
eukprot:TRINITY_DN20152_c0_g1_i1.p1 TRINITY_DN20152_c0_g1~~TRINITY_DN20152_c0_g1_i1.p1  ORF type:complete len:370 (-),score=116.47 TRINITY_DN20152_c0_g1_i1:48-1157(-)